MNEARIIFIGHIETPYRDLEACPRNIDAAGPVCRLVVNADCRDGLLGLQRGQRILILYWLGEADRMTLQQRSRRNNAWAGVFALRTPNRPNPIGAAVLPIEEIAEDSIAVRGLDCLDGTPLIDIKPAMPEEQE